VHLGAEAEHGDAGSAACERRFDLRRNRLAPQPAGFELLDNLRAGVDGMIPGTETIDLQVGIERALREGREGRADELYRKLLPAVAFMMQGLATFLLYGKLIAAHRLGITPSENRIPSDTATQTGLDWARRFAAELGPLPA
jgi:4-hydroxy-tetrahydrodipicolinate synthase